MLYANTLAFVLIFRHYKMFLKIASAFVEKVHVSLGYIYTYGKWNIKAYILQSDYCVCITSFAELIGIAKSFERTSIYFILHINYHH